MIESKEGSNTVKRFGVKEGLRLLKGTVGEVGGDAMVSEVEEAGVRGRGQEEILLRFDEGDVGRTWWWL